MSATLYTSIGWAVEKQTISAGGGLTGPVLVSAVSTDPNTVRLTFDRRLMLEYRQYGVYRAKTLDLDSFSILKVSDSSPLEVVRTTWVNDTTIDLSTANQEAATYRVTCLAGGVMDFWGNLITLQTADFTGQQKTDYPAPADIHIFTSGYAGMQEDETTDFYPDLVAPYLENRTPGPGDTDVDINANLYLDITDADEGVAKTSIRVWVQGSLAYRGDTDTFLAPFNGPLSSIVDLGGGNSYRLTLDRTSAFSEYTLYSIRVYAEDRAVIANVLDATYTFRTEDVSSPYLSSLNPASSQLDVARNANVVLSVLDVGSGVAPASVVLRVNGVIAWQAETAQPGFAVTRTPVTNGHQYEINPNTDFGSYQTVTIAVYAEDQVVPANVLNTSYWFRTVDNVAPYLTGQDPAPDETGVDPRTNIQLDVLDAGAGVDPATVILRVNGVVAWQSQTQQPGFTVTRTPLSGGHRYVINPASVLPVGLVTVAVYAKDLATLPNTLDTSYSFTTSDTVLPTIEDTAPHGVVTPDALISFRTTDDIQVVLASIQVVINGVMAIKNGVFQAGWDGPLSAITPNIFAGYDVVVQGRRGFAYGTSFLVNVTIADLGGVLVTESWTFEVQDDPTCFTGPINDFELSLLVPYDYAGSKLYYTEQLRSTLIDAVTTRPDPIKAIRQIFLRTYTTELASMLRNIVPVPTSKEKTVTLCYKRTAIEIDATLRRKPGLLKAALTELKSLGLPTEHSQLMWSYLRTDQPNDLVPLACLIVCLAKALEKNELS